MTCDKKGYIEFRCPDCNGTGQLPDDETDTYSSPNSLIF
jgi:hypothetical protein